MTSRGEAQLVMRRVDRVEPLLGPVDVLARPDELVLVDARLRAGALDLRDGVLARQDQPAVLDQVAEAGGHRRAERDLPVRRLLLDRLQAEDRAGRAVRLDRAAEVRAAVRDDRE